MFPAVRLLAAVSALTAIPPAVAQDRLRLIVETDAGGDPDDEQSLVRFLLYANEWDVEGIVANRPTARPGENRNALRTGPAIVRRMVEAYGEVYPQLREHAAGYPAPDALLARTVSGCADSEAGVDLIVAAVDRDDPAPVWFLNWGTDHGSDPSNLKRALDRVLAERGPEGYAAFKNRIRLSSDNQFGDHTDVHRPPWRMWVEPSKPKMDGAFMYHRFGPLTATAGGFDVRRDVVNDHGPLGALYPLNTNIPQKEGDTGYFLYLVPTGMNDPMHPEWGSWAGRFGPRDDRSPSPPGWYWANVRDTRDGTTSRDNTLRRWAADLQNDFRARLDWCVMPFADANHPPVAAIDGMPGKAMVRLEAAAGGTVVVDASATTDPDGDRLTYAWECYPEAGTCRDPVTIDGAGSPRAVVSLPAAGAGTDAHIVLTVRDDGSPPLTACRRVIIGIREAQ